jgi:acyl carrier protein
MDLADELVESIVRTCGVPRARVDAASPLADLGVDSLAVAEILVDLEIRLGMQLPVELLRRFDPVQTVREVADLLARDLTPEQRRPA